MKLTNDPKKALTAEDCCTVLLATLMQTLSQLAKDQNRCHSSRHCQKLEGEDFPRLRSLPISARRSANGQKPVPPGRTATNTRASAV
jgi:hypothetical protein